MPSDEEQRPTVSKNFLMRLAKGGVKSIPLVGGLIEEMIFGTLADETAKKEALKVLAALQAVQTEVQEQSLTLVEILAGSKKAAALHEKTLSVIDSLVAALKETAETPPPLPVEEAVERFLKKQMERVKVALAKLPSTNPELFGRGKELATLDEAWDDRKTNIVKLVAFGGVGKTALVNKWLLQMREHGYRGADRVYGWSFYNQGTGEDNQASGDVFVSTTLKWFDDPDPTEGSPWSRSARLAALINKNRTLLILDGLEPLQHPPGSVGHAGRLKDPGLQCLLRELARHNSGLCVVTTRLPIKDIQEFVETGVYHLDLEQLSDEAGVELLKKLGVNGDDGELRRTVQDFRGHALALTLLGRYLAIVHQGEIGKRHQISQLTTEPEEGGHALRMMETYERWFKGKPELDILRILGLFDRPADGSTIEALKAKPAIKGLTSQVVDLSHDEWRFALHNLREARLLAAENPNDPETLDCHPLVREHFGEKLFAGSEVGWPEANLRIYQHLSDSAEALPCTLEEMDPLLLAAVHGCKAGRHRDVLHKVYIPRIMRGDKYYTAHTLGAMGPVLLVLRHFFEHDDWGQPVSQRESHSQGLDPDDQRTVLTDAGIFLSAVRGWGVPEVRRAFIRALELCQRKRDRFQALRGLWAYYLLTADSYFETARHVAEECLDIANDLDRSELLVEAYMMLGVSLFYSGELKKTYDNLLLGIKLYDREAHNFNCFLYGLDPGVTCQSYAALVLSILGYPDQAVEMGQSAVDLARKVPHPFSRSLAQSAMTVVHRFRRDPGNTAECAKETISFAKLHGFVFFRLLATIDLGWSHVEQGNVEEGIDGIHQALEELRATGTIMTRSYYLTVLAECHINAHRYSDADRALEEALDLLNRYRDRHREADLYRVQGRLLGARSRPTEAESRFRDALRTAREQDARSLELRAATDLARLLSGTEQETEAYDVLSAVYNSFTEGFDTADLQEAKALLDAV